MWVAAAVVEMEERVEAAVAVEGPALAAMAAAASGSAMGGPASDSAAGGAELPLHDFFEGSPER